MVTEFHAIPTLVGILVLVIPSMLLGRICKYFGISEIIGFVIGGIILRHSFKKHDKVLNSI